MAKTKISEFDSNPANNTDIDGINIAEGMSPGLVNNAIRELMAQLKDFQQGTTTDYDPFILLAKQAVYPVGSVYINASNATDPSTLLGFGTWAEIGAGKVLIGQDSTDSIFDTLGETGGSKDAIVVQHNHTASAGTQSDNHTHGFSATTNTTGSHSHGVTDGGHSHTWQSTTYSAAGGSAAQLLDNPVSSGGSKSASTSTSTTGISIQSAGDHSHTVSGNTGGISTSHSHAITVNNEGSSGTNANIQPYIVVKMWQRTA